MKMMKFVAATVFTSVAVLGMTLEPAAARGGGGYDWGGFNGIEFNQVGSFVLLTENEDGSLITNEAQVPLFEGLFRDAVLFNGSTDPSNLSVQNVGSGIAFSLGGLTLQLDGVLNIPESTQEIVDNNLFGRARIVERPNGQDLGLEIRDLGAVDVVVDEPNPPVQSVPEPTTVLGSLFAVGMAAALKKKAASSQK